MHSFRLLMRLSSLIWKPRNVNYWQSSLVDFWEVLREVGSFVFRKHRAQINYMYIYLYVLEGARMFLSLGGLG